jgi:hypothetical protein
MNNGKSMMMKDGDMMYMNGRMEKKMVKKKPMHKKM